MKAIIALCMVLTGLFSVSAAPIDLWFTKANSFYEQAVYDSAAAYYQKIADAGTANGSVLYNLGNSCYRLGRIGFAMLNYEKAHKLMPGDKDIIANIRFVASQTVDKVPDPEKGFILSILERLHNQFTLTIQLWVVLAGLCIVAGLVVALFFGPRAARLWLVYVLIVVGGFTLLVASSAGYKIYIAENVRQAVFLEPIIDAVSEPNGNKILFTVHEGTRCTIRKDLGDWCLISLPNGVAGWVKRSTFGVI